MSLDFHDALIRNDVDYMSQHLLGLPYEKVKELIYPTPPYNVFVIAKRNGGIRLIREPRRRLKDLQLKVLAYLQDNIQDIKPCVHGFVSGRSIVTNAHKHCSKQTHQLLNIDLQDFFPSITFFRVRGMLQKGPFNFAYPVATVISHLCTYNNELPQGAPTSPLLSNLICRSFDSSLMALAKRHKAIYTRYADDISFSFSIRNPSRLPSNICTYDSGILELGRELISIIEEHSFSINPQKSRLSMRTGRLEVTGLTINEFPNVKRAFIDKIRGALNAWEKHGYGLAEQEWVRRNTIPDAPIENRPWRNKRIEKPPALENVLWGRLLYVRMVRGRRDPIYTRLAERFNRLCLREKDLGQGFSAPKLPVEPIVMNARDAEQATFVLEWSGDYHPSNSSSSEMVGGQGTAFAFREKNRLLTCDHVLRWKAEIDGREMSIDHTSPDIQNRTLTVHSPTRQQQWEVRVLHRDQDRDLALLEFVDPPDDIRYFSKLDAPIRRNENCILIGYPNWNPGRPANQAHATVLARYARRTLQRIEISMNIRQGNSGGPLVDELYRVAGIAQEGSTQTSGNDECLCILEIERWLSSIGF